MAQIPSSTTNSAERNGAPPVDSHLRRGYRNGLPVRSLDADDITLALAAGLADFRAAPSFGLIISGLYAVAGLILTLIVGHFGLYFLAYPLAAGFALVAPLMAVGLYEVSRLLERGETPTWPRIFGAVHQHGGQEIGYMALVTLFGLVIWLDIAGFLYALFFGLKTISLGALVTEVVGTPIGIAFLLTGNLIGTFIAAILFSISVVSYPMLIDRDVDFVTAMVTSVRAVLASPAAMIGWAAFIGFMLVVAILPMFLGLFLVLPLLGHATWHLYRRAVAVEDTHEPERPDPNEP